MDATKAEAMARAATQLRADGEEHAARFLAFAGVVTAHFESGGVPDEIANAALAASASMRALGESAAAYSGAVDALLTARD